MSQQLTKKDLEAIGLLFDEKFEEKMKPFLKQISGLQSSVDAYLKRTETWHQEFQVVAALYKRLRDVLVEKGIATEEELSLTGGQSEN